ncbi:MAG: DUF1269 domain-containing protein [Planctomycetes bacterium]|nr:DUF1269 domain-containing protein [Planctomycetota bacterium]
MQATPVVLPEPEGLRNPRLRKALAFSFSAAGLGTLLGALAWNQDPLLGSALGAGVGFLLGAIAGAFADWRVGLALLVVVLIGEDSLRKAVPGSPYTISLGKDFLIVACYLCYALRPHLRRPLRRADNLEQWGIYFPILAWMAFVVLEAANPAIPHILVGVSGIRTWLLYMPMMVLMSNFFRSNTSADNFLRALAFMAIPIFVVTLLQNSFYHSMPPFLRESAFQKIRILESGGEVRYNESIFASPTLLALVCVFQLCLVIGLLKMPRPRRQRIWLWISGYCAIMSAHLSGIRTGLLFCATAILTCVPLILYRFEKSQGLPRRHRPGLITGGLIGLLLGSMLVGFMEGNRAEAFWTSIQPVLVEERMDVAIAVTDDFGGGLLGNGTGSAGKSGRVMNLLGRASPGNESVEWGTALVRYSFGVVGMWLGAILGLWALFGLLRAATVNREAPFACLRYTLWVYIGAQLSWFLFKAYPVLENGTLGVLYWSSAGLIIGLRRLDEVTEVRG